MSNASYALVLLLASGAVGVLGMWQLLAGTSRSAELAARGQAGGDEATGRSLVRALDVRFRRTSSGRKLASSLLGAGGAKLRPVELVGLVIASSLLSWVVLSLLFARGLALVIAVGGSILVARGLIERRRGQRSEAFIEQLPDIGRMLANGAAAGLSMPQAIAMASRELADPGGEELRRVVEELRLGQSIEGALDNLSARLPSREVGADDDDRDPAARRWRHRARPERAGRDARRAQGPAARGHDAASGVVFTSYVVAGVGAGTILLLNFMSPGVTKEMTGSPIGIAGIVVAGALWSLAFVLIRRTTRIDI